MFKTICLASIVLAGSARAQDLGAGNGPVDDPLLKELARVRERVDALEKQSASTGAPPTSSSVDLSAGELSSIGELHSDQVLARPWYENLEFSGYGAFTYLDTGGTGTNPGGSFLVKEASLFLNAQLTDHAFVYLETWLTRYLLDYGNEYWIGELYLQMTGIGARDTQPGVGFKFGRIDIPFGEDYLAQDAIDNPLITLSAADPYGIDEGVLAYGSFGATHWVAALTNGNVETGADDGSSKLVAGKVYGDVTPDVYLSASALNTGETEMSAFKVGHLFLAPVGTFGASTAGTSPNTSVDSTLWELDAKFGGERTLGMALQGGQAYLNDHDDAFDRTLTWWQIQPRVRIASDVELVARYSEVGTYDSEEGYILSGKITADGDALGYDASVMRRASLGVLWSWQPNIAFKAELGHDWFELIDGSPFDTDNDERLFFAFEVDASF